MRAAWHLVRDAAQAWVDDDAPSMGAALAYYTLFSIAPLLLIAISVAGLIFGEAAARGEILAQLAAVVGPESARAIESVLAALNRPGAGIGATLVGLVTLLVGATSVFAELQSAMDRVWRTPARDRALGLRGLLRVRLLSLGMVLGVGFLLMVSLLVSAALAALGKWWGPWFGPWASVACLLDAAVSFAMLTALFAMIYRWMPQLRLAWRDVWIGAALTALLFTLGKGLIGLYIGRSGVASPFGAAGSLIVVMLWVYYSAQIFLLGAEVTWVYAGRFGSRRHLPVPTPVPAAGPGSPAGGKGPEGRWPG